MIAKEAKCDAITDEAGKCPVCGCKELDYGDSEIENESYVYDWTCKQCKTSGREYHNLIFACHIIK
jgi:hypothetical protein